MAGIPRDQFRNGDALVLGFVGKHGPIDHIANGENTVHIGLIMSVRNDPALVVQLHADGFETQPVR